MKITIPALPILFLILASGCMDERIVRADRIRAGAVSAFETLSFSDAEPGTDLAKILSEKGLAVEGSRRLLCNVRSGDYRIAGYLFLRDNPRGTVYILHGYTSYSGINHDLIAYLSSRGWNVAAMDLPGHGLSSGERGGIRSIAEYAQTLKDFLAATGASVQAPLYAVAHSTGCCAVLELIRTGQNPFKRNVFCSPLVKPVMYKQSVAGHYLLGWLMPQVGTSWEDPFASSQIPQSWIGALKEWNDGIRSCPRLEADLLVLQGRKDKVTDWEYNTGFIRMKIPGARIEFVDGGWHELFTDRQEIRDTVYPRIDAYLSDPSAPAPTQGPGSP